MSEEFKKLEPRVKTVEEAIRLLTELTLRHEERLDDHEQRLAEQESAERNLTAKMEALVDAQIRTEDALQRLTAKVDRLAGA